MHAYCVETIKVLFKINSAWYAQIIRMHCKIKLGASAHRPIMYGTQVQIHVTNKIYRIQLGLLLAVYLQG